MYLILISLIFGLYVIWRLNFRNATDDNPPGLSGSLPFIGHALQLSWSNSIKTQEYINKVSEECMKKGGILSTCFLFKQAYCLSYCLTLLLCYCFLLCFDFLYASSDNLVPPMKRDNYEYILLSVCSGITDPDAIETVLQTCFDKIYIYRFAKQLAGEGLITGNGELWKRHRKLLNPAFGQQILNSFIPCFNSQARRLVKQLMFQAGKSIDHEEMIKENNLESACKTVTGVGSKEYSSLQARYLELLPKYQIIICERFKQFWYHSDLFYKFSNLKRNEDLLADACSYLSQQIIKKKKEEMNDSQEAKQTIKNKDNIKSILEYMLDLSNENSISDESFTDDEIKYEIDTIIAAAHETSGTVLNLAMILLGSYPKIQEKLYIEVMDTLGNADKDLNKNDVNKLVYTEAVLKETLRLYPPIPVAGRHIDKDVKLKNYTLKANSLAFVFLNGLNRHPAWGPDADQFKPERWLDANTLPGKKYFGSFTSGKRNCIGKAYAMISMKITLAHVIQSYHISADIRNVVFKWYLLTYPASGHHYVLQPRKRPKEL